MRVAIHIKNNTEEHLIGRHRLEEALSRRGIKVVESWDDAVSCDSDKSIDFMISIGGIIIHFLRVVFDIICKIARLDVGRTECIHAESPGSSSGIYPATNLDLVGCAVGAINRSVELNLGYIALIVYYSHICKIVGAARSV